MIKDQLTAALRTAAETVGIDPLPAAIELERPQRREHGDWSTNLAMVSAKKVGKNPRELAGELVAVLEASPPPHVTAVEIAGPGFVNFRLDDGWLHDELRAVIAAGPENFGRNDSGAGTHINVEFVSANPNKPLHAGHARGAIYGDAVARLLEAVGHQVTREYYLNDRGTQMQLFAESLAARKRGEEPPDDGYQGDYLIEWSAEMPDDADPFEWGYARALRSHRDTLFNVRVDHDVWFSERSLVDDERIGSTLAALQKSGASYKADGATWLRTTDEGDDKDRVLVKTDGDLTYLTPDVAYHLDKFERADRLINVWGADHHGYVVRMKAAMKFLGNDPDDLEIIITQQIALERDGEAFRMSGRLGDMVAFDDVLDEIGPDEARFTFLLQSMDSTQTIDLSALAEKSMDNPVHYVQYAHARIPSLVKNAAAAGFDRSGDADLSLLTHDRELEVLRRLNEYPETVAGAAADRAPHRIINWLRELAAAFHGFYHDCYVVGDDISPELTRARLELVEAARIGFVAGLDLVGVSAPDEM